MLNVALQRVWAISETAPHAMKRESPLSLCLLNNDTFQLLCGSRLH